LRVSFAPIHVQDFFFLPWYLKSGLSTHTYAVGAALTVGERVGDNDGDAVGEADGDADKVGEAVGDTVGEADGVSVVY